MAQDFAFIPLYYGRSFVAGPGQGSFTSAHMDAALNTLCNGSYFDGLKPFGAGTLSLHASGDVAPSDPPASWSDPSRGFTTGDVASFIVAELDAGRLPKPSAFAQTPAYVVILKQGLFSKDNGGAVGVHYDFTYQGQSVACAWVMQGKDFDGTTGIAGHEMVEIVSSALGFGELADPCKPQRARVNGVMAEAYESAVHTCVVPHVYSKPMGTAVWMVWRGVDGDAGIYYSWLDGDWERQLPIPNVGTSDSPALCRHDGSLYLAWKGMGSDQRIWWSTLADTGWAPQRRVPGAGTSSHPALASFDGTLYMAWKGVDGDEGIWWTKLSRDRWDAQKNIPARATSTGVSLFAGSELHMAWKGMGHDAGIYTAEYDPGTQTWAPQFHVPGVGTSDTPVMAVEPTFIGEPDKMLMTWKGVPGDQGIYESTGTDHSWSPQEHEPGVATSSHSALLGNGSGLMWRAWKGVQGDQAIWWAQGDEGITWSDQQVVPGVGTSHGPSIALH